LLRNGCATTQKMEFTYQGYAGRIVLNPTDFILRIEHTETHRIYEHTFFEHSFDNIGVLGGLEFVERMLRATFCGKADAGTSIKRFEPTARGIQIEVEYATAILPRPITLTFNVPALKKATAAADLGDVEARIKQIESTIPVRVEAVETKFGEMLRGLMEKIAALEERTGDHIVIPGCPYAIPTSAPSLELVLDKTSSGSAQGFVSLNNFCKKLTQSNGSIDWNAPISGLSGVYTWTTCTNVYPFTSLSTVGPLKFLRACTALTISGTTLVANYGVIGELTQLKSLTITGSRTFGPYAAGSAPPADTAFPGHVPPPLTDISWIKTLTNLTNVCFRGCTRLVDITPLRELPNLATLDIRETGVINTECLTNPKLKITRA
jgi:hypothetical protein